MASPYAPGPYTPLTPDDKATNRRQYQTYIDLINANPMKFDSEISKYIDGLSNTPPIDPRAVNASIELQIKLRNAGLSKSTTPLGSWTSDDVSALKDVMKSSYVNGTLIDNYLTETYPSSYIKSTQKPTTSFNKTVSTAIHLLDKQEAADKITAAYLQSFGYSPNSSVISDFLSQYNVAARKNAATTTTSQSTSGIGSGSTRSTSTSITTGAGMNAEREQNFIADYLKKNLKIDDNTHGYVKTIVDQFQKTAANNLLPAFTTDELQQKAASIIGIGDSAAQKQALLDEIQKIRNVAAKLNPGAADLIAAGNDVADIVKPYQDVWAKRGLNLDLGSPYVSRLINYEKNGKVSTATLDEADTAAISHPDWQYTSNAKSEYLQMAQAFARGAGR